MNRYQRNIQLGKDFSSLSTSGQHHSDKIRSINCNIVRRAEGDQYEIKENTLTKINDVGNEILKDISNYENRNINYERQKGIYILK